MIDADHFFELQHFLSDQLEKESKQLGRSLAQFDARLSIAALGGMQTVPILQSNAVRLRMLSHLMVANAAGRTVPNKQYAAKWFAQAGQISAHLEDAAEDVFTSRVHFEGGNYVILESLVEGNGYHLQHMLAAMESMPNHEPYRSLKVACRSLLTLSDLMCRRAGLAAFCDGNEVPMVSLPLSRLPTVKALAARVTFTDAELKQAKVDVTSLNPFLLHPGEREVGLGGYKISLLEQRPLIAFKDAVVVALPGSIGSAIRWTIIQACKDMRQDETLRLYLLESLTQQVLANPALRSAGVSLQPVGDVPALVSLSPVEFQPGYWLHLVLLPDDFSSLDETGFAIPGPSGASAEEPLSQAIAAAAEDIEGRQGFKVGITLLVMMGYGRSQKVAFERPQNWLVEGLSSYDLEILGWRNGFNIAELFKFLLAEINAENKGFPLVAINGLMARLAFAYENGGHVVPHEHLPDGIDGANLLVPINGQLKLRREHHARYDKQVLIAPAGDVVLVRRNPTWSKCRVPSLIYRADEDMRRHRYRAVWNSGDRQWWLETLPSDSAQAQLFRLFEMQFVWAERIAPVLCKRVAGLPKVLTWYLVTPQWPSAHADQIVSLSVDQLRASIKTSYDSKDGWIRTEIGPGFYFGLSRHDNASEVALVEAFTDAILTMTGNKAVSVRDLLSDIVPSVEARQLHAFAPQDFRDHVRGSVAESVAEISQFDDAAQRLGLGWHGVPKPGGTVQGRDQCTAALNAIAIAAEEMFCQHLAHFERHALVEAVVANHEAAQQDKTTWERTAGATLELSLDPDATREYMWERMLKANATGYACRVILEAALCESPVGSGYRPGDIDLSHLMAQAMTIHHLGGYSDAIRYEGMRPEIRISPAGEVEIDTAFFEIVVKPFSENVIDARIASSRRSYPELQKEPELAPDEVGHLVDPTFAAAWEAEIGVPLLEFRCALEALENRLFDAGQAFEFIPRNELLGFLSAHITDPNAFICALEYLPRQGWKDIAPPFNDQDRQPWRFRRRLAVSRRPILRLDTSSNAEVVIAPGMIRDAFKIMLQCYYHGYYDRSTLASQQMKEWRDRIVAKEAAEFEEQVVNALESFGWQARRGVKFSHVLGRKLDKDPGDIDVLAWHPDGRIVLLECKDLQFAQTASEIAKQLSKFRGKVDDKGRPDLLNKHLMRMQLAHTNADAFGSHLKLLGGTISGALVFSTTVPMSFAAEQIGQAVRLLTYDDLAAAFGPTM